MRESMSEPTNYELLLAIKEQMRQMRVQREHLPAGVFPSESEELYERLAKFVRGQITLDQLQAMAHASDETDDEVVDVDDLTEMVAVDAENETKVKGFPLAAGFLVRDAARRCGDGLTRTEWISEVLAGHADDEGAQLGCLNLFVKLWSDDDLWAWPRI